MTIEIVGDADPIVIQLPEVAGGTTLETVMRSIDQIPIKIDGSGTTAFVDQIGDTKTSSGKGWTFTIDGEFAEAGIGSTLLQPPTNVTWEFSDGGF